MGHWVKDSVVVAGPRRLGSGVALGFDFGKRRVGVAVGDLSLRLAQPLPTLSYANDVMLFDGIELLVQDWKPSIFVVGSPTLDETRQHPLYPRIRDFGLELNRRWHLGVYLADESYSSVAADAILAEVVDDWKKRKKLLDSFSAKIILETFFSNIEDID